MAADIISVFCTLEQRTVWRIEHNFFWWRLTGCVDCQICAGLGWIHCSQKLSCGVYGNYKSSRYSGVISWKHTVWVETWSTLHLKQFIKRKANHKKKSKCIITCYVTCFVSFRPPCSHDAKMWTVCWGRLFEYNSLSQNIKRFILELGPHLVRKQRVLQ